MVLSRLFRVINHLNFLYDAQAGFRKHKNTMDHVMNLAQHVKDGFPRKISMVAGLEDFQAAYDTGLNEEHS